MVSFGRRVTIDASFTFLRSVPARHYIGLAWLSHILYLRRGYHVSSIGHLPNTYADFTCLHIAKAP